MEMKMTANRKSLKVFAIAMTVCVLGAITAPVSSATTYTPPVSTLRIGLYFGPTALPSANLLNVTGSGSGFEYGYFDENRNFIPIGVTTDETAISMLMDRNMSWYAGVGGGAGEYREGTEGTSLVGCFHIQIDANYDTYDQAAAAAENYNDSFVRYRSGRFYALMGQYTTRDAANSAISSLGLSGVIVDAGTSNTITVVKTGTNRILFEFDYGGTYGLGVMPRSVSGENCETWFKGYRYSGGFQYSRRDGALLTVINYIGIEDYVKGILPYEMSNTWPLEALKAQACCARTYALSNLGKHDADGADLCTEEHCQVYRGRGAANARTDQAVDETAGQYVTYNNDLCETYYASSNGGASESAVNVWGEDKPYLVGVIDPYEAAVAARIPGYDWTITFTPAELTQRLQERGYNCATVVSAVVSQYSPTGNAITVTITDANGKPWVFSKRAGMLTALGTPTQHFYIGNAVWETGGIYANDPAQQIDPGTPYYSIDGGGVAVAVPDGQMYAITGTQDIEAVSGETGASAGTSSTGLINGVFTIQGRGRGHNVGMSQWGAYSMAEYYGKNYIDIIQFYYTGVEIG